MQQALREINEKNKEQKQQKVASLQNVIQCTKLVDHNRQKEQSRK